MEIFAMILLSIVMMIWIIYSEEQKHAKLYEDEKKAINGTAIGETMLDRFFVECVLAEVNDFSVAKNIQRAQLLAKKYNLEYPNGVEALYQKGLEEHKSISTNAIEKKLEEKRTKEKEEFKHLNKYSDLTGKDKRIAMLTDRANELSEIARDERKYADSIWHGGQLKEKDWAAWGGVADGLAGFGAGVMTAMEIQEQNMKIREHNEKMRQATLPYYMSVTNSSINNQKNANAIMKEIAEFRLKLISDNSSIDLFKKISFSNTDILISETGAAMVCTLASLEDGFTIFGDVPAVVDGTIIAQIFDGEQLCGTALMVFPVYGIGKNIPLNGICLNSFTPGKNYTVKFAPKSLCALEK